MTAQPTILKAALKIEFQKRLQFGSRKLSLSSDGFSVPLYAVAAELIRKMLSSLTPTSEVRTHAVWPSAYKTLWPAE